MNYVFNVLWFEDNSSWFGLEKLELDSIVEKHCLKCNIVRKRGSDFAISELEQGSFDLILMDYDLATDMTGEKIIFKIREANIFTDILFYSSQYDSMVEAIRTITPPIDGIYYSSRKLESFHEKLSRLTAKIVQRSENLINLRGFVLDNTSDFELRIKEALNICWQKFNEEQRERLTLLTTTLLDRKISWITKQVEDANTNPPVFTYANNDDHLLSISDRLDILNGILPILFDEYSMPSTVCVPKFKEYYIDNVNIYRNRLGHIKLGEKIIRIKGRDVEINQEFHRLLRKNIASVEQTLTEVERYLTESI